MKGQDNTLILLRPVLLSLYKVYSIVGAIEVMPTLAVTRVGKYYRTTIPREVRKILEINENDEIEWILENGKIFVRKRESK